MESIIIIEGLVDHTITLDPGVWIFDDRKVDLNTCFDAKNEKDELTEYTKAISKHWDREITEGAVFPPTLATEKKYEKEKVLTGSFGIPLKDFLRNAGPKEEASSLIVVTAAGEFPISLETAYNSILGFSKEGKPLREDGPVHLYFGDGSNKNDPIKEIRKFMVR